MLHEGHCQDEVISQLRRKLWNWSKYPNPDFFSHGIARYRYPGEIKELLKLRFFDSATISNSCESEQLIDEEQPFNMGVTSKLEQDDGCTDARVYQLSLPEVIEVPQWKNISHLLSYCPYPHLHETPLSWILDGDRQDVTEPSDNAGNKSMFPVCCYKDQVCCAIHCRDPIPQAVHYPGPWVAKDIKVLWR